MADSGQQHDGDSHKKRPSSLLVIGAVGGLGFELVGFVVAGLFIGMRIDAHFDSEPVGVVVSLALALMAVGVHSYQVIQRFLNDGED